MPSSNLAIGAAEHPRWQGTQWQALSIPGDYTLATAHKQPEIQDREVSRHYGGSASASCFSGACSVFTSRCGPRACSFTPIQATSPFPSIEVELIHKAS